MNFISNKLLFLFAREKYGAIDAAVAVLEVL